MPVFEVEKRVQSACLKSCGGAGGPASWGHSKHVIGQEGTREWSKVHEIQLGLTDTIAFCDEMPPVGTGNGLTVDAWLQGGFQHHLIILGKEASEELINISNTM